MQVTGSGIIDSGPVFFVNILRITNFAAIITNKRTLFQTSSRSFVITISPILKNINKHTFMKIINTFILSAVITAGSAVAATLHPALSNAATVADSNSELVSTLKANGRKQITPRHIAADLDQVGQYFADASTEAEGNAHEKKIQSVPAKSYTPLSGWKSIGEAVLTENAISWLAAEPVITETTTEVLEHPTISGFYALVDPWVKIAQKYGVTSEHSHEYLFINASAGHNIYITDDLNGDRPQSYITTGINLFGSAYSPVHIIGSEDYAHINDLGSSHIGYAETDENGNVTINLNFTVASLVADYSSDKWLYNGEASFFNIKIDRNWSEWELEGTLSFPQEFMDWYQSILPAYGSDAPLWEQPFNVWRREATDGSGRAKFKFENIFNGVDIVFDYDPETMRLTCPATSTDIAINRDIIWDMYGQDTYETYLFQASGFYYESSHLFRLNPFLMINEALGFSYNNLEMTIDGYTPQSISLSAPYVPSSVNEATVTINKSSDNIKTCRVVTLTADNEHLLTAEETSALAKFDAAGATLEYHDYTSDTFTVDVTGNVVTRVYVLPFDKNNKLACASASRYIYHNAPLEGEWEPMGKGKLSEILFYDYLPWDELQKYMSENMELIGAPEISEVEVERLKGNPSRIRVKNPFNTTHSFADKLPGIDDKDTYYMVFDISNPAGVTVERTISGLFEDENHTVPVIFTTNEYETQPKGVYSDLKITMPPFSLSSGFNTATNQLELELPGYTEYSMTWGDNGQPTFDDQVASISIIDISKNIGSVKYLLVNSENAASLGNNLEELRLFIENAATETGEAKIASVDGSGSVLLSFKAADIAYGTFYFAAAAIDAEGHAHAAMLTSGSINKTAPIEEWKSLGEAEIIENATTWLTTGPTALTLKAEVKAHPAIKDLYCLVNPWEDGPEVFGQGYHETSLGANYLVINNGAGHEPYLTNDMNGARPSRTIHTGFILVDGYPAIQLLGADDYRRIYGVAYEHSTPTININMDGYMVIDFSNAIVPMVWNFNDWIVNGTADTFTITFPATAGVDSVDADTDSNEPVEYYNLQGVKVDNPVSGIYIRKQGDSVSKVAVK